MIYRDSRIWIPAEWQKQNCTCHVSLQIDAHIFVACVVRCAMFRLAGHEHISWTRRTAVLTLEQHPILDLRRLEGRDCQVLKVQHDPMIELQTPYIPYSHPTPAGSLNKKIPHFGVSSSLMEPKHFKTVLTNENNFMWFTTLRMPISLCAKNLRWEITRPREATTTRQPFHSHIAAPPNFRVMSVSSPWWYHPSRDDVDKRHEPSLSDLQR